MSDRRCPYFSFRPGCRCRHCRGICKCDRGSKRVDVTKAEFDNPGGKLHV